MSGVTSQEQYVLEIGKSKTSRLGMVTPYGKISEEVQKRVNVEKKIAQCPPDTKVYQKLGSRQGRRRRGAEEPVITINLKEQFPFKPVSSTDYYYRYAPHYRQTKKPMEQLYYYNNF